MRAAKDYGEGKEEKGSSTPPYRAHKQTSTNPCFDRMLHTVTLAKK